MRRLMTTINGTKARLLFFDIETTGFSRTRDRIIELAIWDPKERSAVIDTLVNPRRSIPKRISQITGIDVKMVRESHIPPFDHVADRFERCFRKILKDEDAPVVLVGHNARRFDAPFLTTELNRSGYKIPEGLYFADTLEVLRSMYGKDSGNAPRRERNVEDGPTKFSLQYLMQHFNASEGKQQTHRALDDCVLLANIIDIVRQQRNDVDVLQELTRRKFTSFASNDRESHYVKRSVASSSTSSSEASASSQDVSYGSSLTADRAMSTLKLPPMLRQYCETKRAHSSHESRPVDEPSSSTDPIVLYRVGDFYEAYFEDADRLGRDLDMVITAKRVAHRPVKTSDASDVDRRAKKMVRVPMCGFPVRAASRHCRSLMDRGHVVVICDQMETAASAASKGASTVERRVTRVLTPGTVVEGELLEKDTSNYLVSLHIPSVTSTTFEGDSYRRGVDARWGLCYADVSTGECRATEGMGMETLRSELQRLSPKELLVPANLDDRSLFRALQRSDRARSSTIVSSSTDTHSEESSFSYAYAKSSSSTNNSHVQNAIGSLCFAPLSSFALPSASAFVRKYFGIASLEGIGLQQRPIATSATSALLRYVEHTRPIRFGAQTSTSSSATCVQLPRCYDVEDGMGIDEDTWRNLEICETARTRSTQGSLLRAVDRTETPMGRRLIREWLRRPLRSVSRISRRQSAVRRFVEDHDVRLQLRSALRSVDDISRLAGRASAGTASPHCLLSLADSLSRLPHIMSTIRCSADEKNADFVQSVDSVRTAEDILTCSALQTWASTVRRTLASPETSRDATSDSSWISDLFGGTGTGQVTIVRPGADPDVDRLRAESRDHRKAMEDFVESERQRLGVSNLSLRSTRMFGHVIAVPARVIRERGAASIPSDYRRQQSIKAEERFSTPKLIELDACIKRAESRAIALEQNIFERLLGDAAGQAHLMRDAANLIARLDVLSGLATLATDEFYCLPNILEPSARMMDIVDGRHPVVEQFGDGCVANSVSLGTRLDGNDGDSRRDEGSVDPHDTSGSDLIVLTGPNAAGKSVFIRQTAIIQLLAQIGSYVPASFARLSVVDRIFTRAGGADDISRGQSTFMVEMSETANILNHATSHSLVLLDEIGRGTATYDGLAIAQSVAEYLSQKTRARTIFATHYHELNDMARVHDNVATMQATVVQPCDESGISFTYEMSSGGAKRSYGVEVARLVGFPDEALKRSEDILGALESTPERLEGDSSM